MLSRWYKLSDADPSVAALQRLTPEHVMRMLQASGLLGKETSPDQLIALDASYQPGESLRASFAWQPAGDIPLDRVWAEGRVFALRSPVREPMSGRGCVAHLDGVPVELYALPRDRRLRDLKHLIRRDALADLWASWFDERIELRRTFLRYVPESKFICQVRPASGFAEQSKLPEGVALRITREKTAKQLAYRHRVCAQQAEQLAGYLDIPGLAAADTEKGLVAIHWMGGLTLDNKLRKSKPERIINRLVQATQQFHQLQVDNLTMLTPAAVLAKTNEYLGELHAALSTHRRALQSIGADLSLLAKCVEPAACIKTLHNDLNWAQVQVRRDRYTILDLECMAIGDPLVDIAHMDVCLELAPMRDDLSITKQESDLWRSLWLEEWGKLIADVSASPAFHFYRASSAIRLACGMLSHLRPVWPELIPAALRSAEQSLSGQATSGVRR